MRRRLNADLWSPFWALFLSVVSIKLLYHLFCVFALAWTLLTSFYWNSNDLNMLHNEARWFHEAVQKSHQYIFTHQHCSLREEGRKYLTLHHNYPFGQNVSKQAMKVIVKMRLRRERNWNWGEMIRKWNCDRMICTLHTAIDLNFIVKISIELIINETMNLSWSCKFQPALFIHYSLIHCLWLTRKFFNIFIVKGCVHFAFHCSSWIFWWFFNAHSLQFY